jgi:hypothetical protein
MSVTTGLFTANVTINCTGHFSSIPLLIAMPPKMPPPTGRAPPSQSIGIWHPGACPIKTNTQSLRIRIAGEVARRPAKTLKRRRFRACDPRYHVIVHHATGAGCFPRCAVGEIDPGCSDAQADLAAGRGATAGRLRRDQGGMQTWKRASRNPRRWRRTTHHAC